MFISKSHYHNSNQQIFQGDRIRGSIFCNHKKLYHTFINTNSYLWNYFTSLTYFKLRNLVFHRFWHAQWDLSASHLILLQIKKSSSLLPTSMATNKNIQASTTATSIRLGMATTNNYIGAINHSQPKASDQL